MNNSRVSFISSTRKPPSITSQWNYILYLRFGLPFKTCTLFSILSKKYPVWCHWDWRVFYCNMRFHWKKIGLPCLIHIHENDILPVKFPTACMECNRKKFCGCRLCMKPYLLRLSRQNIQSTNWQTMRFKPPPPNTKIGWRVEFRPMEVQLTDFENAAFTTFLVCGVSVLVLN